MEVCGLKSGWTWPAAAVGAAPQTLPCELAQLHDEFQQVAIEATVLAAPLTDVQFTWKPAANAWSIGECLSHLNATARQCLPKLDEGIAEGIRAGLLGEGPFRYGWVDRFLVHAAEPPSRWHVSSPAAFLPVPGETRDEILDGFRATQTAFADRLRRAYGLDLVRVRVASPVARWRRFSLGAAFAVLAAHQRRHLGQARRVVTLPQFPR
jgi:hypothetical protein